MLACIIRPVSSVRHGRPCYTTQTPTSLIRFRWHCASLVYMISLQSKTIYVATPKRLLLPWSLVVFPKDRSLYQYSLIYKQRIWWGLLSAMVCYRISSLTIHKFMLAVHSVELMTLQPVSRHAEMKFWIGWGQTDSKSTNQINLVCYNEASSSTFGSSDRSRLSDHLAIIFSLWPWCLHWRW